MAWLGSSHDVADALDQKFDHYAVHAHVLALELSKDKGYLNLDGAKALLATFGQMNPELGDIGLVDARGSRYLVGAGQESDSTRAATFMPKLDSFLDSEQKLQSCHSIQLR